MLKVTEDIKPNNKTLGYINIMLLNYVKIAIRNIMRNKLHSFINIFGLAVGITCALLIFLWIQDELNYDKFHENANRLYRVVEEQIYPSHIKHVAVTMHPLAPSLEKDYPEIIDSARWNRISLRNVAYEDKQFNEPDGAIADPSFFKMFTFPFLKGNSDNALSRPYSITGIFSGIYPAFFLSSFTPVNVLKGIMRSGRRGIIFKKSLVLSQWSIAIILIIGSWYVLNQFKYLKKKDLGFDHEQLIYLRMDRALAPKYQSVKDEFLNAPGALYVTSCMQLPVNIIRASTATDWEGKTDDSIFSLHFNSIDFDFIEAFGMEIIKGRSFSKDHSSDIFNNSEYNFILNETAIKQMEISDPIGKWISSFGLKGRIVGVVKDFHFKPLNDQIEPMMLGIVPYYNSILVVKVRPDDISGTIESLKNKLKEFNPNKNYEFRFVNDDFNNLYKSEELISKIMEYFTVIGIFIACLGLFALVGFMAEDRTKEIGIRKTMGASVTSIILLITKDYIKLVIMANIIAWPVAYYFLGDWLNNYAYRINLHWAPFIITGLLVLIICQIAVSYHSIKAAIQDPIKALRYE